MITSKSSYSIVKNMLFILIALIIESNNADAMQRKSRAHKTSRMFDRDPFCEEEMEMNKNVRPEDPKILKCNNECAAKCFESAPPSGYGNRKTQSCLKNCAIGCSPGYIDRLYIIQKKEAGNNS